MKIMIQPFDQSAPAKNVTEWVEDAIGTDASEMEKIALAYDIAVDLYGQENADAFVI